MRRSDVVASKPSRRVKKSNKPERREDLPVDTGGLDMESATPSQQSAKAGPGTGGGRERSRRISERMPKAAGAKAHEKSHAAGMLDKGVGKKQAEQTKQRTSGRRSEGELSERPLIKKQPRRQGAKKQRRAEEGANGKMKAKPAAAPAEAAPTQKQVLRDKPQRTRRIRNEGVGGAE